MKPNHWLRLLTITSLLSFVTGDAFADEKQPLRIYILAGQSNMQGHAEVRTFDAMRLNPATAPLLKKMVDTNGSPRVCRRVWITSIGSADQEQTGQLTAGFGAQGRGPKIGPEFTFGITMEDNTEGPILVIKTAWGGKSLNTDFRPPTAGPYEFSDTQLQQFRDQKKDIDQIQAEKKNQTGHYYRLMIDHVKSVLKNPGRVCPDYDAEAGYQLAGFVWFQGWNDMVDRGTYPERDQPDGYHQYSQLLTQFIHDVRKDLSAPELPFVIGVLGVGGPVREYGPDQKRYSAVHQNFRDAMAAPASLPEFRGNVTAVLTENYWDQEVTQLRARERDLKPQQDEIEQAIKSGQLSKTDGQAAIEKLYAEHFSERERTLMRDSVSNAEFHYLGSAGITGQIGQAFAQALLTMEASTGTPPNN